MNEHEIVAAMKQGVPDNGRLPVGIGDDAAVLAMEGSPVVTVDLLTDGVDFIVGRDSMELIARKAIAVNISDLAAMAAIPHSVVIAVALPSSMSRALVKELLAGFIKAAEEFNVTIAGGDTNRYAGQLVISVTAIGTVGTWGTLQRNGAKPGDAIIVTGRFGGSILRRQFRFSPRVQEAIYLKKNYAVNAGIDVSDGLLLDLTRLAHESGVGFVIEEDAIPIHPDAWEQANSTGRSPLDHALSDGEDFELILAVDRQDAERLLKDQPFAQLPKLTKIGEFCDLSQGQIRVNQSGQRITIDQPGGFVH